MKLYIDLFLKGIEAKKIYYFSSNQIDSAIPHYFICILKMNDDLFLVCCTSDKEGKRRKRAEKLGLHSTSIWINPNEENGFKTDTYMDCNTIFNYSLADFRNLYEQNLIEYNGEVSEIHFEQIINGLLKSPDIEADIKEMIKNNI